MNKKMFFSGLGAIALAGGAAFSYNVNAKSDSLSDFTLANIEALASNESGSGDNKICYYKGSSEYKDWYECTADYPSVGSCGNTSRVNKWFSTDKHVCNL